jgi:hypothetical protein
MNKFLLLLGLLYYANTNAQWTVSSYPTDLYNFDLIAFHNKDTIIGLDATKGIYASYNGGDVFFKKFSGFPTTSRLYINNGTLIRMGGFLWHSNDFGSNWVRKVLLNDQGDTIQSDGIIQQNLFKNGEGFTLATRKNLKPALYISKDFGSTWFWADSLENLISTPISGELNPNKMFTFDSTAIVQNYYNKKQIWIFENYGKKAFEVNLENLLGQNVTLLAYAFENENTGLLVCQVNNVPKIYKTADRLKTLNELSLADDFPRTLDYAKPVNNKKGFYILGYGGASNNGSFYSIDQGESWIELESELDHRNIQFYDASIGISSGFGLTKVRYMDGSLLNSIEQNSIVKSIVNIFPNPASNEINISSSNFIELIKVYSNTGELVLGTSQTKINVENLKPGIFFIEVQAKNGDFGRIKWIKL